MRGIVNIAAVAVAVVATAWSPAIEAAYFTPRAPKPNFDRIRFEAPSLAPMAHTRFCLEYPDQCEVRRTQASHGAPLFRGGKALLTHARWSELNKVNLDVNQSIVGEANRRGILHEKWVIGPTAGDCNDYAVTKRHALLARGWPSRSLLLAEVSLPSRQHHLVLIVRTSRGDFVLDNLNGQVRPWSKTPYRWVRVQSPENPKYWMTVAAASPADRLARNSADGFGNRRRGGGAGNERVGREHPYGRAAEVADLERRS